jgi:hypothetical protein
VVRERNAAGARNETEVVVAPMVCQIEVDSGHRGLKISTNTPEFNATPGRIAASPPDSPEA